MTHNQDLFQSQRQYDRLFVLVFLGLTILQVVVLLLSPLDLAADEAYYWDWSRRLDWAYYSKGPLVALLISASTFLFGHNEFAVRFPAVLCLSLFSIGFYVFVRKYYSASVAFWGWLSWRTALIFVSQGFTMTTDPPTALCWFLALVCFFQVLSGGRSVWWLPAMAFVGLGALGKFTLVILYPSIFALLVCSKALRFQLKSKNFWLSTLLLAAILSPVLIWNYQHGWVNIQHNAGHLGSARGLAFKPVYVVELLGSQLGLLGPVLFCGILYALYRAYFFWRNGDNEAGLYFFASLPLFALCILVACTRRVYANWPMPVFIGGALLLIHLVTNTNFAKEKIKLLLTAHLLVNGVLMVMLYLLALNFTFGVPGSNLPSKKLYGWREASDIANHLIEQHSAKGELLEIVTDNYEYAAELGFYLPHQPNVFCASVGGRRMNQYDIWGGWEKLKGKNALLVLKDPKNLEEMRTWFEQITPLDSHHTIYSGSTIRRFNYYLARNYNGHIPPPPTGR